MKKGKEIEDEISDGHEENKDFEWNAISNMIRSGGFIAKLRAQIQKEEEQEFQGIKEVTEEDSSEKISIGSSSSSMG